MVRKQYSVYNQIDLLFSNNFNLIVGGQPLWHHLECFEKLRMELGWFAGGHQLPGFSSLSKDDQANVTKVMP